MASSSLRYTVVVLFSLSLAIIFYWVAQIILKRFLYQGKWQWHYGTENLRYHSNQFLDPHKTKISKSSLYHRSNVWKQ